VLLAVLPPAEVLLPPGHVVAVVQPGWRPGPGEVGPVLGASCLAPDAALTRALQGAAAQLGPGDTWTWLVDTLEALPPLLFTPVPPVDATGLRVMLDVVLATELDGEPCRCASSGPGPDPGPSPSSPAFLGFVPRGGSGAGTGVRARARASGSKSVLKK
jgi:hypothetical protein